MDTKKSKMKAENMSIACDFQELAHKTNITLFKYRTYPWITNKSKKKYDITKCLYWIKPNLKSNLLFLFKLENKAVKRGEGDNVRWFVKHDKEKTQCKSTLISNWKNCFER